MENDSPMKNLKKYMGPQPPLPSVEEMMNDASRIFNHDFSVSGKPLSYHSSSQFKAKILEMMCKGNVVEAHAMLRAAPRDAEYTDSKQFRFKMYH